MQSNSSHDMTKMILDKNKICKLFFYKILYRFNFRNIFKKFNSVKNEQFFPRFSVAV